MRRYAVPFSTPFGPMAILWETREPRPRIVQILLPTPQGEAQPWPADVATASCPVVDALLMRFQRFFQGEAVPFPLEDIALERCSPFQRRVLLAEYAIPRGWVSTYGLIAAHLGKPGAGRAVGRALATNPFPIVIPCHRAVRSDLTLGGYQAGLAMKRALLEMEGVPFQGDRVNGPVYYAEPPKG